MDGKFTSRTYQIIPGLRAYDFFCIFPVSLKMRHFHVTTTGISLIFGHDADVKERALRQRSMQAPTAAGDSDRPAPETHRPVKLGQDPEMRICEITKFS